MMMKHIDFRFLIKLIIILLLVKEILPCDNLRAFLIKTEYFSMIGIKQ